MSTARQCLELGIPKTTTENVIQNFTPLCVQDLAET
jgi:hypothetical protein